MAPSLGLINLLEKGREFSLLKDIVKDTDEQLDEELHRWRPEVSQSAGASVPMELECVTLLVCMCLPSPALPKPRTGGVLWRLRYIGMINYYF